MVGRDEEYPGDENAHHRAPNESSPEERERALLAGAGSPDVVHFVAACPMNGWVAAR